MSTSAPALEISDLEVSYGHVAAVRGVSLEVNRGEIVCIIGANGAGKSTTLKAIVGSAKVVRGAVKLEGRIITNHPSHRVIAGGVGFVPENRRLFNRLTVRENLMLGAFVRSDKSGIADSMEMVCGIFPVLGSRMSQASGTLSGGEQQMVAIGRALMSKPSLLLLDEPSLGLAPLLMESIFTAVQKISQTGMTILMVEQNARMALQLANRGYVMETGHITLAGSAAELTADPEVQRAYLGRRVES